MHLKYIKLSIVILLLLLLISTLSFSIFSKNLMDRADLSKNQINALIDEVGEVKEKNRVLTSSIEKKAPYYEKLSEALDEIASDPSTNISDKIDRYQTNFKQAAKIEEKVQQEVVMMEKSQASDMNDLDFLIVGHNSGLTDTIILASINKKLKTITFLSIPRDLYIDGRKINEFYEFYGIEKLIEEVSKVTGIRAEKHAVVDMATFQKLVDLIGGIDITVEKDIYDQYFPDGQYYIQKGDYHFDGTETLKYARSRKTTSDFDRGKRQQQILKAIKAQIEKAGYVKNVKNLVSIYTLLVKDIETNIDILETVAFLKRFEDHEIENGNVLSTDNFLYSMINENGAYILLPENGSYDEVKTYVQELIEK